MWQSCKTFSENNGFPALIQLVQVRSCIALYQVCSCVIAESLFRTCVSNVSKTTGIEVLKQIWSIFHWMIRRYFDDYMRAFTHLIYRASHRKTKGPLMLDLVTVSFDELTWSCPTSTAGSHPEPSWSDIAVHAFCQICSTYSNGLDLHGFFLCSSPCARYFSCLSTPFGQYLSTKCNMADYICWHHTPSKALPSKRCLYLYVLYWKLLHGRKFQRKQRTTFFHFVSDSSRYSQLLNILCRLP